MASPACAPRAFSNIVTDAEFVGAKPAPENKRCRCNECNGTFRFLKFGQLCPDPIRDSDGSSPAMMAEAA